LHTLNYENDIYKSSNFVNNTIVINIIFNTSRIKS